MFRLTRDETNLSRSQIATLCDAFDTSGGRSVDATSSADKVLAQKLDGLERKYKYHDKAIAAMLSAIRQLMHPPARKRRSIGFTADLD